MIAVSIIGPTVDEAIKQISQAEDLVELRLDHFTSLSDIHVLRNQFPKKMIFTLRSKLQKGLYPYDEEQRLQDIRTLCALQPEYIDIESHVSASFIEKISKEFPLIKIIISYHNFQETPLDLEAIYKSMQRKEASLYKIALQANSSIDALRFLVFAKEKENIIPVSMGPFGQISRIIAPVIGSPITYASSSENSSTAPGQISFELLKTVYRAESLNKETLLLGLLGDPVNKSLTHETHNHLLQKLGINAVYVKIPVPAIHLKEALELIRLLPFKGLSVTMPLKEAIIPFIDDIDPQAKKIGAVNTLLFSEGKIHGYNTDGIGALTAIEQVIPKRPEESVFSFTETPIFDSEKSAPISNSGLDFSESNLCASASENSRFFRLFRYIPNQSEKSRFFSLFGYKGVQGKKIVILGAGGAAKAIAHEALSRGAILTILNRDEKRAFLLASSLNSAYGKLDDLQFLEYDILINCTPSPMPINPQHISHKILVMDIVTRPIITQFLQAALERNCLVISGYHMFVEQAIHQFNIWFQKILPTDQIRSILEKRFIEKV